MDKPSAQPANVEKLTTSLENGTSCDVGLALRELPNSQERFALLQQITDLHEKRRQDDPNLPDLKLVISASSNGSGGATILRNEGGLLEVDWTDKGQFGGVCLGGK